MKRAALFVGVNRYEDPEINPLEYAEKDAAELYAFFKHRAGYEDARLLLSPDSDELLDTAHEMAASLDPEDLFVFFFAGHGVEHEGRHLLLCPKARYSRLKYHQHAVPLDLLKQETVGAGIHRVLILDACRSNLLKGERSAGGAGLRDVAALRNMACTSDKSGGSLAILCSCDEGQQARESEQCRQGLFTLALIEVMSDLLSSGHYVALTDALEKALANKMAAIAQKHGLTMRQRPWLQRSGWPPPLVGGKPPLSPFDGGLGECNLASSQCPSGVPSPSVHEIGTAEDSSAVLDAEVRKTLKQATAFLVGKNAKAACLLLRQHRSSGSEVSLLMDVFLGIAMLSERFIGAMRLDEIQDIESLLVQGLEHPQCVRLASYGLAAIRHCFYRDHMMREPPPKFEDLVRRYADAPLSNAIDEKVLRCINACEDFHVEFEIMLKSLSLSGGTRI